MHRAKLIAAAALAILAIVWILQNTGSVQTRFLFVTVTMPVAALLAITLLIGATAGILVAFGLPGPFTRKPV
jgi:lipopolysaccharide assembly protein A